ncbi:hypothetical protein [Streptomyces sp. SM11]|uniref:hypothetical protein n=1 Tax=Streptomyces sp. SM11 TaxID=565557 RepID=UPI0015E1755E|nr:hypothetical protein [Streptomyces sp. SM11]
MDDLPALDGFADGLGQGLDAGVADLTMQKRQMFGRASFDPLRKRSPLTVRGCS